MRFIFFVVLFSFFAFSCSPLFVKETRNEAAIGIAKELSLKALQEILGFTSLEISKDTVNISKPVKVQTIQKVIGKKTFARITNDFSNLFENLKVKTFFSWKPEADTNFVFVQFERYKKPIGVQIR